jgi:photosystem II stability/assembly factor-like uncharacterized protein
MRDKIHHQQHPLTSNRASLAHQAGTRAKYISPLLRISAILVATTLTTHAKAQWDIEESHTTASLRGIHNAGGGVAWASGTHGTVLRTEDGGYLWQTCNIPPGAENLDFRGIQAFDENTAIVMSSGPGDQSRLYKTTDGCQTWHLLFTNPDKEGFWDALKLWTPTDGFLAGDQVDGKMTLLQSTPYWKGSWGNRDIEANSKEGAFAASNSSLSLGDPPSKSGDREVWFATGGPSGSRVIHYRYLNRDEPERSVFSIVNVPIFPKSESAGIFSIFIDGEKGVTVGGDYLKPDSPAGTAAFTIDGGKTWAATKTPPHGYRSAVAYDSTQKLWITVGPNGTDISRDDGRNWQPLKPSNQDPADADKNWNALSLPFVVGPNGRIGRLRTITPPSAKPQVTK